MPWRPCGPVRSNSELDQFRSAAALLIEHGQVIAHLVFDVETHWRQVGGHLWWRRWAGREVVHGYESYLAPRSFDDWVSDPGDPVSKILLEDLVAGRFTERAYDDALPVSRAAPVVAEREVEWLDEPDRSELRHREGFR